MSAERLWARLTPQDRRRLGGDFAEAYSQRKNRGNVDASSAVSHSPGRSSKRPVEVGLTDEATRNWLMREIGELDSTSEETIAAAVESGSLVLVEQGRHAYWKGEKIGRQLAQALRAMGVLLGALRASQVWHGGLTTRISQKGAIATTRRRQSTGCAT